MPSVVGCAHTPLHCLLFRQKLTHRRFSQKHPLLSFPFLEKKMPTDTEAEEARKAAEIAEIHAREAEANANALEAEARAREAEAHAKEDAANRG
jgi:hypothetical protein